MRRAVVAVAAAILLATPTVLAFFSGGYFAGPRLTAALVTWVLVLVLAVAGPAPLPRTFGGRLALGGLVALIAWSAASIAWAPLRGPAVQNVQRLVLYAGALTAAAGLFRERALARAVEPALAAGALVVIGYGLAGRLLPGVVHLAASRSAGGRLEQPLTYWNAEGALAAIGLLLCTRLAGDETRRPALRAVAAGAVVPLAAGVYLSFSRGAIAVAAVGLVVLAGLSPTRAQGRAALLAGVAGALAAVAAGAFAGVASLHGTARARERDGAIVLALLAVLSVAAAAATVLAVRREHGPDRPPRWARWARPAAAIAVAGVAAGLVIGALGEKPSAAELSAGATASRLTNVASNRYEYWRVGLHVFAQHPVAGLGAGGFRVAWLQDRHVAETVKDVHSLEIEMLAELGLVGLACLMAMVAGVALAGRRALAADRVLAAGPCAAALAWLLHASIDWDWEMPAVTLPAVILAGTLIAVSDAARSRDPAEPARRAPAAPPPDRAPARSRTAPPTR